MWGWGHFSLAYATTKQMGGKASSLLLMPLGLPRGGALLSHHLGQFYCAVQAKCGACAPEWAVSEGQGQLRTAPGHPCVPQWLFHQG